MPFQIIKSNKALPPVDVLIRFEQTGSEALIKNPFRDPPDKTPTADVRVIPSPRTGIPSKYIYSSVKPASREEVAACYREIFEAIPQHGWHSVAVPLCPSTLPPQEVYRIACAEVRRTLAERDMQILLIADSVKAVQPENGLFHSVQQYIKQHFTGFEAPLVSPPKAEKEGRGYYPHGGSIIRPKLRRAKRETSSEEESDSAGRTEAKPLEQQQADAGIARPEGGRQTERDNYGSFLEAEAFTNESPGLDHKRRKYREESAFFTGLPNPAKLREREERERETGSEADAKAELYGSFLSGDVSFSKEEAEAKAERRTDAALPVFADLASFEGRTAAEEELAFDSIEWPPASPKSPADSYFAVDNMIGLSDQPCREEGAFTRFDPQAGTIRLDESFPECVLRLIDQKGLTDPECYSRANLSRAVFNKLKQSALDPEKAAYKPSKSTALALAVALELGIDEANDLLQKAGFALSHSSKGDIIVEYFLANHLYDIFELNEVLFKFGEPLLGSL